MQAEMQKDELIHSIQETAAEIRKFTQKSAELEAEIALESEQRNELKARRETLDSELQKAEKDSAELERRENAIEHESKLIERAKERLRDLMEVESRAKALEGSTDVDADLAENGRVCENLKQEKQLEISILDDQRKQKVELLELKRQLQGAERQILRDLFEQQERANSAQFRILEQLDRGETLKDWW